MLFLFLERFGVSEVRAKERKRNGRTGDRLSHDFVVMPSVRFYVTLSYNVHGRLIVLITHSSVALTTDEAQKPLKNSIGRIRPVASQCHVV